MWDIFVKINIFVKYNRNWVNNYIIHLLDLTKEQFAKNATIGPLVEVEPARDYISQLFFFFIGLQIQAPCTREKICLTLYSHSDK
jgi:hypothetical protein